MLYAIKCSNNIKSPHDVTNTILNNIGLNDFDSKSIMQIKYRGADLVVNWIIKIIDQYNSLYSIGCTTNREQAYTAANIT